MCQAHLALKTYPLDKGIFTHLKTHLFKLRLVFLDEKVR